MPPMVDPFEGSGYGITELSLAISSYPRMYGRIQQLGIAREMGVTTRTCTIERDNGTPCPYRLGHLGTNIEGKPAHRRNPS